MRPIRAGPGLLERTFLFSVDGDARKSAGRLYSTVEHDARSHRESTLDMALELFCDSRNERGLRF